jgi:hypothetical protein
MSIKTKFFSIYLDKTTIVILAYAFGAILTYLNYVYGIVGLVLIVVLGSMLTQKKTEKPEPDKKQGPQDIPFWQKRKPCPECGSLTKHKPNCTRAKKKKEAAA